MGEELGRRNKRLPSDSEGIRVAELFAGVGGFRLGLVGKTGRRNGGFYEMVWANQWEPSTKVQHAADVYRARFKDDPPHFNEDITSVIANHFDSVPDHDLLVGGFPCQDYSVAKTLRDAKGLIGKKGTLWWMIYEILKRKKLAGVPVRYLLLENVDRLLNSPAHGRGRDFEIMLASLANLGYAVEWRVINAADYGFPQRRRRIFILAYLKGAALFPTDALEEDLSDRIYSSGILSKALRVAKPDKRKELEIPGLHDFFIPEGGLDDEQNFIAITEYYNRSHIPNRSKYLNAGFMIDHRVFSRKVSPVFRGRRRTLGDCLVDSSGVDSSFFIPLDELATWRYLKGPKAEPRKDRNTGHEYFYQEGGVAFPDGPDKPSRTIITGEGGRSASRFKHVIAVGRNRFRRLTPVELERLSGFPDNHTAGVSDGKRAFFVGNALVVGVVARIGKALKKALQGD
jgi:DNA (cytosine-5)-methyltransferase 1